MDEKLAVIMPVYNEAEIVSTVVFSWCGVLEKLGIDYSFFVYDDGSGDNSFDEIQKCASENPRIIAIQKNNEGHGPTILRGYRENCTEGRGFTWLLQIDSDNELPASEFSGLWEERSNYDFLIGRRDGRSQPISRKIVSFVSRMTIRLFYGSGVWDVNSPYRLMRVSKYRRLFDVIPANTFAPNILLSGYTAYKKLNFFEHCIVFTPRNTGEVSIKKLKLLMCATKSFLQTVSFRFALMREKEI